VRSTVPAAMRLRAAEGRGGAFRELTTDVVASRVRTLLMSVGKDTDRIQKRESQPAPAL
jgi:hypothetical protein